jgi:hypothetical protein
MALMKTIAVAASALGFASSGYAAAFVNGGFENGTISGWTTAGGGRTGVGNSSLTPAFLTGTTNRSAVIAAGTVDPNIGAALGTTVYSGAYGYRVEDTTTGGLASLIQQTVLNYTDSDIFFAWKAVLENGGHSANQSAVMIIELKDLTTNSIVISRIYNAGAGGSGVDSRFTQLGGFFYTANWQIEQLAIDATLSGHDFLLSVLAADCQPSGHTGYVYLDGFGSQIPQAVAEPATFALLGAGFGGLALARRRKRA